MAAMSPMTAGPGACRFATGILVASLFVLAPHVAAAGSFEDAAAAYDRHDYETAWRLLLPLGEQGDARAQATLGAMAEHGFGVAKSDEEAALWRRRAAEQGDAKAQFALSGLYDLGHGAPLTQAYLWLRLAAASDDDRMRAFAARSLAALRPLKTPAQIAEAERLPAAWKAK